MSNLLTLPEAAEKLGCSEKTLWRLIKQVKIRAVKRSFLGKRQWTIEPYDVSRYLSLYQRYQMDKWVERHVDYRLTLAELCEDEYLSCATVYPFPPWKARLPTVTLLVSLADYLRYTSRLDQPHTQEEHESIGAELRRRIDGEPKDFQVRFLLNPGFLNELQAFIREVRPPGLPGLARQELRRGALLSLTRKLIPADVDNPKHYIKRAIKNYFRDQGRLSRQIKEKRLIQEVTNIIISHERDRNPHQKTPLLSRIDAGLSVRKTLTCPKCETTFPLSTKEPIMECPFCHYNLLACP